MEPKPGIYQCPRGAGELDVTQEDIENDFQLIKGKAYDIQGECLESSAYMCHGRIGEIILGNTLSSLDRVEN